MAVNRKYTIFQAEDKLWCLRMPEGEIYDGESYVTEAAAQASADRKNTCVVKH